MSAVQSLAAHPKKRRHEAGAKFPYKQVTPQAQPPSRARSLLRPQLDLPLLPFDEEEPLLPVLPEEEPVSEPPDDEAPAWLLVSEPPVDDDEPLMPVVPPVPEPMLVPLVPLLLPCRPVLLLPVPLTLLPVEPDCEPCEPCEPCWPWRLLRHSLNSSENFL